MLGQAAWDNLVILDATWASINVGVLIVPSGLSGTSLNVTCTSIDTEYLGTTSSIARMSTYGGFSYGHSITMAYEDQATNSGITWAGSEFGQYREFRFHEEGSVLWWQS